MNAADLYDLVQQIRRPSLSDDDAAVMLTIKLQNESIPALSRMLGHVRNINIKAMQGKAAVRALCERMGCSLSTGYRALRNGQNRPEFDTAD